MFVKYGPCSRHRLAPVARLQDKVVCISLCTRVDVHIELSYGPVQHDMLKLRGSLGKLPCRPVRTCLRVSDPVTRPPPPPRADLGQRSAIPTSGRYNVAPSAIPTSGR